MIYSLAIGTYTEKTPSVDGHAKGIYRCQFNSASETLTVQSIIGDIANPSYVVANTTGAHLYSGSEHRDDPAGGNVVAFTLGDKDPRLGVPRSSHGSSPCHLSLAGEERWLLVANYNTGTIATLPVSPDGNLGDAADVIAWQGAGPNPERQSTPHAHQILAGPDGRIYAVDLGTDRVWIYDLNTQTGKLTPASPQPWLCLPPGSGPRHLVFGRDGSDLYVITELGNTIVHCTREADGNYRQRQEISSLPAGFTGSSSGAAIRLSPSGRHLYASNRWHDSIACFAVDATTGSLESRSHFSTYGKTPRDFALTPDGEFLLAANQDSSTVTAFRVNVKTGALRHVGEPASIASPVCIAWIPTTQ